MRIRVDVLALANKSEVIVEDEAKSPHNVEVVLHFVAVEAHDLLCLLEYTLDFFGLVHHVCLLGAEGKF